MKATFKLFFSPSLSLLSLSFFFNKKKKKDRIRFAFVDTLYDVMEDSKVDSRTKPAARKRIVHVSSFDIFQEVEKYFWLFQMWFWGRPMKCYCRLDFFFLPFFVVAPEEIGEPWQRFQKGFRASKWRAKCRCGQSHLQHRCGPHSSASKNVSVPSFGHSCDAWIEFTDALCIVCIMPFLGLFFLSLFLFFSLFLSCRDLVHFCFWICVCRLRQALGTAFYSIWKWIGSKALQSSSGRSVYSILWIFRNFFLRLRTARNSQWYVKRSKHRYCASLTACSQTSDNFALVYIVYLCGQGAL